MRNLNSLARLEWVRFLAGAFFFSNQSQLSGLLETGFSQARYYGHCRGMKPKVIIAYQIQMRSHCTLLTGIACRLIIT